MARLTLALASSLSLSVLAISMQARCADNPAFSIAEESGVKPASATSVAIEVGTGRVINLHGVATSVFAADPKIAEVRPASARSLFVFGVAPGRTTVAAMDSKGGSVGQFTVTIRPSSFAASQANAALARQLPGQDIKIEPTEEGATISGHVETAEQASQAATTAKQFLDEKAIIDNHVTVGQPIQVELRVRIAEMSRNLTRQLGIDWSAMAQLGSHAAIGFATNDLLSSAVAASTLTNSYAFNTPGKGLDINNIIDALNDDQLVHLLAEPNLTTMSGEAASFLVGGEFPIPVSEALGETNVIYKQYGVALAFVPTVLSSGRINMHVRPEVSELSTAGAVRLQSGTNNSISIPALTVRRAETTIELGSGQSFAIAGLLQDNATLESLGPPWLSELPILGALFRSSSFQHNETELVIVVTPYIVRPVSDPNALRLPTDGWQPPNDLERILLLRQSARGSTTPQSVHIPGNAGFILE
jgi:pilus assembly protein CpaC